MDGKLPPWNIHGGHSSSIPYTSGECHEARDLTGESMPSLSSCMSGAFRALLPDYHGTSSAMTANPIKYSYSPDDHCVIRSGTGMSYSENTIERREKFNYIKESLVYPKYTQYVPQEKDRELDQGNSHNWTSVIKHALEMSNGMEMEHTVDVCSPLVDFNPVYKEPQMELTRSKPNEKQDGLEVKGEHNSFITMLSDGTSKQQNVQEMAVNQESDMFAEGSSLRKGEPRMTVIRGHEPGFSLPGFYSSHNPHLLEGYVKCDEFSLVKRPTEHTSQKTPQEPGLSCQVGSPNKTQESHTNSCFGVNNEIVSDNSPIFDLHNLDLPKYSVPAEIMDGKMSVNSHHHSSNYNDQQEMGQQSHLDVSNTMLRKHFENQVTTSPLEEEIKSNLSVTEDIEPKGSVHTKNTELSLNLKPKFVPEIVSFSNPNSTPDSQKVPEQLPFSHKMYIDDTCKDSQKEQGKSDRLNTLSFQENNLTTSPVSVDGRTYLHVQEKHSPTNQSLVHPSGHSEMCEQTFLNNGEERSNHSTQHNLQNALQTYQEKKPRKIAKKPRKRKKTELEELNDQIHKSTKMSDCSLYESDISDGAVKPDKTGCEEVNDICPLTDNNISALEEDTKNKNDNILPQRKGTTPKKSKIESDCITQSCYAAEYQCVSQLQSSHEQPVTTETSQKQGHNSEDSHEKATSNKNKPSVRKTVYGRKRKRASKICSKATNSNQNNISYTSNSQVTLLEANADSNQQSISNLQSLDDEYNPEISKKSRRKKSNEAQHTLQSKEDLPSQLEDVSSSFEADQVDQKVKKLQKARRPSVKALGDKNYKHATILDGESLIDSVSPTDSVLTSPNIQSPQKNPRKPRQKKRVDVSEVAGTLNASPAVLQQKDATSPLARLKEIMQTTKKTRPVKAKRQVKRASRKNVNEDHETAVLDIETFTDTLTQDSVSVAGSDIESPVILRTRKTFGKKACPKTVSNETVEINDLLISDSEKVVDSVVATEKTKMTSSKRKKTNVNSTVGQACLQPEDITTVPSKFVESLVASNPGKTVKARRFSNNKSRRKTNKQLNSNMDEEASLLSTVTQENAILPLNIDSSSSYRRKKLRKKTVTEIKHEAEQTLKVNHTESQHEDLTTIPDPIIAASSTKLTLKSKRPAKKAGRRKVKTDHGISWDMQTLNQADCVPTSFVLTTTPKKSKTVKKMSDLKIDAINSANDQTMPRKDISAVHQESKESIVPPKKRFRTPQTLTTDSLFDSTSENYESVHVSKHISPATGNTVNFVSATETDCSHVVSQKNPVRKKRSTKKVNRRKRRVIQANSSFGEQTSPEVQEQNSALTRNNNKNHTPDYFDKDIVNETTEDPRERQVLVSTETVASPKRKPKKNWLRQKEKSEQELHYTSTETAKSLSHEVDKMSNLQPALESVSENFETSEADSCDQKWKAARRKSKKSKEIAETHEFATVSLSQEVLSPTKMKTEAIETDVMVTSTDVQDFSKLSDVQTVKGFQFSDKDGSEVDHKNIIIRQEPTIKGPKVRKARKTKKRKPSKQKRKYAGRSTQRIKEEEQRYTCSDNVIACDVETKHQAQINDNSARTIVTQEEPVNSDVYISRKSTRIQKINLGPVVERKVSSTDITEDITLSGSMNNSECKDLIDVHEISVSSEQRTPKRGRPRKQKLVVTHLEDVTAPVHISDHPLCQSSTENNIEAAGNQVILEVVQHPKKRRGRKKKKKLTKVTKQLETDPLELNDADQTNNNLSQSIPGRGHKHKNLKAPRRNHKLSSLKVTGRTSELDTGEAETSSLPQNSVEVEASLPRRGTRIKRKLDDITIQDEVATADEKIVEINFRKRGRRRQLVKELCFDDLETQPEQPHKSVSLLSKKKSPDQPLSFEDCFEVSLQSSLDNTEAGSEICGILPSNVVKEEEPETVLLDTKIRSRKGPQNSSETEIVNTGTACEPSEVQKVDDEHVVIAKKSKIGFKAKEKTKKPLTCKYCGVSFRHITAYVMHQRIHTGEKPYKCKFCGKTFAHLSKLKSHRNVHEQHAAFPCPCCNQTFMKKKHLLCHFKVHLLESKLSTEPKQDIKKKRNVSSKKPSNSSHHICKICNKNFGNQVKLRIHMRVHEAEMPLMCKDCGKTFKKPSSLAAHEKSHWPVKPYACSICGKGFSQLKALKMHSQIHTGETPFSCSHCGHAFSAMSALRVHQASKTCISKRTDGESGVVKGFIVSQEADSQVNTPVFFKCQICKQLYKKWCQYTLHLQTHTSSSPYLCFSCGQCYEKDSEVSDHCKVCCQISGEEKTCRASVSENIQGLTQTDLCLDSISKKTSDSSQSLPSTRFPRTRQKHTTFPSHPPEFERTQTRTSTLLEKDAEQSPIKFPNAQSPAHSEASCTFSDSPLECIEISPSLWKFQCSRCGQRFERYRMLCAHIQTHAPAFRYTCAHCGQFFERWSKLWLHQRRHRRKGRCYSCTQCSLQFRFLNSYKEHMFDHAGQRPYACPLCPKTFIQEKSLHAHQYESHKLCESLKCDVCSKTFSSLRNLIKHSLLHNGSTSHVCLLCSLSFTNTRAFQQHLNTHNGYQGLPLPDIASKPLTFPHKCRTCKACFSTGDLLYAHQICHSRDAKTKVRPESKPTSKSSNSRHTDEQSGTPLTNHVSKLKLDGIPNDKSLYVYSHPDRLYVNPSLSRVRHQVIHIDSNELSDSQNTSPQTTNSTPSASSEGCTQNLPVATSHLPQDTSDRETTNLKTSESVKDVTNDPIQIKNKHSHKHHRRSTFVETSVNMEVETVHEEYEECFECADCTEKLTSVIGLYEHYILHAMGDTYVQVH
ncbi:uncharacterized protein [Paramisgurnus dabryanus]|uniref:uncharacterized protein n=1 Tax=Paramisgurnus dabryanus TaxID=90735 RepID=UPI0031F37455